MATALAWNFVSMAVIRFLFGIGEAGAWPSVARVYSRWIPLASRGRIQGIFFAAAHLSGGLTPFVVVALADWLQWRMIFIAFGLVGALWALAGMPGSATSRAIMLGVGRGARSYRSHARHRRAAQGGASWTGGVQDPDRGAALRPGLRQLLRLLFLHHLAADLSGPGAWPERHGAGR